MVTFSYPTRESNAARYQPSGQRFVPPENQVYIDPDTGQKTMRVTDRELWAKIQQSRFLSQNFPNLGEAAMYQNWADEQGMTQASQSTYDAWRELYPEAAPAGESLSPDWSTSQGQQAPPDVGTEDWRQYLGPVNPPSEVPDNLQSPEQAAGYDWSQSAQDFGQSFGQEFGDKMEGGFDRLADAMTKSMSRGSERYGMSREYPDKTGWGLRAEDMPTTTEPDVSRAGSLV